MSQHHHHVIIDSLRRLLLCRRRSKGDVDSSYSSSRCSPMQTSSKEDTATRGASSSDSTRCHPRPSNRSERRRRKKWQADAIDYRKLLDNANEDTESVRTLCSYSTDGGANITPASSSAAGCSAEASERSVAKPAARMSQRAASFACEAEICHLEQNSDHLDAAKDPSNECGGYILARSDDLVVTDYPTESVKSNNKSYKVVNNALVSYQHQLNAELCEVNCHSGSSAVRPNDAVQVSTNLSNMAMQQPNSCAAGHQQPTLRVHAMSEGSEPRTTCASVTASEQGISCEPLASGCWPCGDVSEAAAPVGDVAVSEDKNDAKSTAGASNHAQHQSAEVPAGQTNDNGREDSCKMERFGALSGDQCDRLCHGLQSNELMDRYLAKRDISDTTKACHRQRCGRITAELMQRILQLSGEAAAASNASASTQRHRESRSQPLSSVTVAAAAVPTAQHPRKAQLSAKWSLPQTTAPVSNNAMNGRYCEHQSR